MKKYLIWIILGLLVIVGITSYNGLVSSRESVNKAWANVETQYQRRSDLIPNLVNTVKGAADFEKSTLEAVTEARSKATSIQIDPNNITPEKLAEFQAAQAQVSGALGRLLAVAENYPQLKAVQNFSDLQAQLEGTENRITEARRQYNEAAQGYNTGRARFPRVIFASLFGFKERPYFEADKGTEKAPTVKF
ncbi:MAG: LemA family protein [Bacteroidetes bacterium]|nr:LemA family protein [Bacteroidota bacterium]MBL0066880.1 LemA family protein [Bacteroidota bacterium]MBL0140214.1 LemA family protein [Bacteroidota bacterium]